MSPRPFDVSVSFNGRVVHGVESVTVSIPPREHDALTDLDLFCLNDRYELRTANGEVLQTAPYLDVQRAILPPMEYMKSLYRARRCRRCRTVIAVEPPLCLDCRAAVASTLEAVSAAALPPGCGA